MGKGEDRPHYNFSRQEIPVEKGRNNETRHLVSYAEKIFGRAVGLPPLRVGDDVRSL
jgi:aconitase B